jgi:hypothetical protein
MSPHVLLAHGLNATTGISSRASLVLACMSSGTFTLSPGFEMGEYSTEIDFSGKDIVIFGQATVLDAKQQGRFFYASNSKGTQPSSLELHGLILQNGRVGKDWRSYNDPEESVGGAINVEGGGKYIAKVKIYDSCFKSNVADSIAGCGIKFSPVCATSSDCPAGVTCYTNTLSGVGGAINVDFSQLEIRNTSFFDNVAGTSSDGGGGIFLYCSSMKIFDSTFQGNLATGQYSDGGGAFHPFVSQALVSGCSFLGNDGIKGHNDIAIFIDSLGINTACIPEVHRCQLLLQGQQVRGRPDCHIAVREVQHARGVCRSRSFPCHHVQMREPAVHCQVWWRVQGLV